MPISTRSCPRWLRRCLRWLALVCLGLAMALALLTGCQSRLIYFPRPYPAGLVAKWTTVAPGQVIDFTTAQGHQHAFMQGQRDHPRNLWLVCGGNGSLALDWSAWLSIHAPREDAWLLVDFPGYGDCHGTPSPAAIRDTFDQLVPLAMQKLGWSPTADSSRLRIFGHSLGAAACLIAAADHHIQRGVLLAPFTSTMDMTRQVTGLPLGFLVWHRFDNSARLADLARHGPGRILILHGSRDEVIPAGMSRHLATRFPALVELQEIKDAHHNTVQDSHSTDLARALREVGHPQPN
ncbi:MAG: alpha/beta hydrolase [Verrucomicrobia bacterium]|nr:MAG: alpha/beta hydrolase [Verrucomicrobiota bacterium]